MFGLILQNPAAWVGAFALLGPLVVHLLTRRTPRRLVFPTVRFIRQAQSNLSALFRVRHWLLLIVRTLLLALLLAAFLRPYSTGGSLAAADPGTSRRAVAIIIDDSMSMGYAHAGASPIARARQSALEIVDKLGAGGRCNVIVAASAPRAVFDELSDNRFPIRREIEALKPTLERADFNAALTMAVQQLAKVQDSKREIVIISDFQRDNWTGVNFATVPQAISTTFISAAEPEAQNAAISELKATPGDPILDEPVEISCKVENFSGQPRKTTLQLDLGEDAPLVRDLDLPKGGSVAATFHIRVHKTGQHEITARLPADDLAGDDVRCLTLPVSEKIEALVLTEEPLHDLRSAHHYLVRALDPFGEGAGEDGPIRCTVRAPDAIGAADLGRAHLLLLCGVKELSATTAGLLLDYLRGGGGMICFLSSPADQANLATLQRLAPDEFQMPFDPGAVIDYSGGTRSVTLVNANYDDPILRPFREMPELGKIQFRRLLKTEPAKDPGQVLASFSDGNAALARQNGAAGSLLLCNFSPSPDAGDLARSALFVPLMQELAEAMRPQSGAWRAFKTGGPCLATVALDPSAALPTLESPSGEKLDAVIQRGGSEAMVVVSRALERGFYRVRSDSSVLASMPVNVDPRESDLTPLTTDELRSMADGAHRQVIAADGADAAAMARLSEGRMIWPLFVLAGMLLLPVEQLLSQRWRA